MQSVLFCLYANRDLIASVNVSVSVRAGTELMAMNAAGGWTLSCPHTAPAA